MNYARYITMMLLTTQLINGMNASHEEFVHFLNSSGGTLKQLSLENTEAYECNLIAMSKELYEISKKINQQLHIQRPKPPIITAIENDDLESVKAICEDASSKHVLDQTYYGNTPLAIAFKSARCAIAKYLIEKGASVNIKMFPESEAPLHHAVIQQNIELITLLLQKGAEVNTQDRNELTPLVTLVIDGIEKRNTVKLLEIAQVLIRYGASIFQKMPALLLRVPFNQPESFINVFDAQKELQQKMIEETYNYAIAHNDSDALKQLWNSSHKAIQEWKEKNLIKK